LEVPAFDNEQEVQAFYAANPDRFVFASPEDLPQNLRWQDGSELDTFADPNAKRGGTLSIRLAAMQQTLRMVGPDANSTLRGPLWSANTVGLIEIHPWQEGYIPGTANQWAIDPEDSRTIYLRLDPDARWSDGTPLTMEDVFFTAYFSLSPHLKAPAYNRVWDDQLARLTRYDDLTFAITQKKRSPEPLMTIAGMTIVQREFYREFGEDYVEKYHWRFAPVTGAYTLNPDKVERGRQITMDRIPDWWGDQKPFLRHRFNPDHLRFTLVRDDSKAFEAFLIGDFDWHDLTRTDLWHERANEAPIRRGYIERAKFFHHLPAAREGVYMNARDDILADRTLRLGVQHAINYELVNSALYRSDRRRIRSFSDGFGPYSHPQLRARPFNIDLAADYFRKAGYTERGADGILMRPDGTRLSLVMTVANEANRNEEAAILQTQARKAGLDIVIDSLDRTAFFTKVFEKKYQLAIHSWNTGYSKLPLLQWELRGVDAGKPSNFNTTNIEDARLDELINEWDQLQDPERAKAVAHEVQERVHDFAAWVPGLTVDYQRWGYWRWVKWPDYFQVPRYFFFMKTGVFWIDEEVRVETQQAMQNGLTFPPQTITYERWRRD
jgi:microcin C transport system substrate-binding protein